MAPNDTRSRGPRRPHPANETLHPANVTPHVAVPPEAAVASSSRPDDPGRRRGPRLERGLRGAVAVVLIAAAILLVLTWAQSA